MLRRSKFPPLPDTPTLPLSPPLQTALSPPPNRLQRRREDSAAKSGSLNCKLQRRQAPIQREEQGETPYQAINDYYPPPKEAPRPQRIERTTRGSREGPRLPPAFESAPVLPEWQREKRQEEMSTQLSKQSECPQLPKEVRFGGVIEGRPLQPKREKVRSPSILKNGRSILSGSLITSKERERSCSVASGRGRAERQDGQNNTNKIIKQKYRSIVTRLQTETQAGPLRTNRFSAATYHSEPRQAVPSAFKYRDEIFPPVAASLFAAKKGREKIGEQVTWMRLSEVFKGRSLTVVGGQRVEVIREEGSFAQEFLLGAMNCLAGCPKLLEKIFQGQSVSPYGVYLLRVYQENAWKYIIIDDYIPIIRTPQKPLPAFLSIRITQEGPVDIWPFLLEKAYANYYSRYQALQLGTLLDFVEELSGTPSRRIQLRTEGGRKKERMSEEETAEALVQVKKELTGDTIAVGELFGDKGYVPIFRTSPSDTFTYLDPQRSFAPKQIHFNSLPELCRTLHIISPFKFQTCTSNVIRKPRTGGQGMGGQPLVRIVKVQSAGAVAFSVRQRERRLFHLKEEYGQYIWSRVLLLQKEGQHGWRWIAGEYAQRKAITFTHFLQPGEYWLLVQPEWRPNSPSELTLHIYARDELPIQRGVYRPQERVIEGGCLDLAQRFGQLNQINKFICSYNYVSERVGLIIENIVNQRVNGDVTVMRSIRGLKCKVQILPVNREFYQGEQGKWKVREEIELDIPKGENFTVVLKLRGGVDRKFFKSFDFGC